MPKTKQLHASEHDEQSALLRWSELQVGRYPELEMLAAVPNGGLRTKATAGKLKAEGVKPGYLDLQMLVPRGPFHGLLIEMKSMTGSTSKEQKEWISRHTKYGYRAVVCKGWVAARDEIVSYLGTK